MGRRCVILNRNIYKLINLLSSQTQMKKLFILSMILLSLTLVWCAQNKLSQDELFNKKQECLTYKDNLQKDIDKDKLYMETNGWSYSARIKEIFYSPVDNTCIGVVGIIGRFSKEPNDIFSEIQIIDILENQSTSYELDELAYQIIAMLKWE